MAWPSAVMSVADSGSPSVTRGKPALGAVELGVGVVGAFDVGLHEAVEGDDLAARRELGVAAVTGAPADLHRHRLADGVLHLAGDRTHPDQLVEPVLVAGQAGLGGGTEAVAGGADRLVRLLRVLDLAGVDARLVGQVLGPVELGDLGAGGGDGRLGQGGGVRTHVGDEAVLVQLLGDLHGGLRAEAELAARLLLERRRTEGRVRRAAVRLGLHRADREGGVGEGGGEDARGGLVQVQDGRAVLEGAGGGVEVAALGDALAVDRGELGGEGAGVGGVAGPAGGEGAGEVPVLGGAEGDALALTLDDQTGGDGLHAAAWTAGA